MVAIQVLTSGESFPVHVAKIRNLYPVCQVFRRSEENAAVLAVKREEVGSEGPKNLFSHSIIQLFFMCLFGVV